MERTTRAASRVRPPAFLLLAACAACGEGGAGPADVAEDAEAEAAEVGPETPEAGPSPAWFEPDPLGRTTEGNLIDAEPEMALVTSAGLADAWTAYARHRTLSGVLTRVVTMDEVLSVSPGADDAESLREYLRARRDAGALRFVLLGGDAEEVPFRRVESYVTIPLWDSYSSNGPADLYFGELDADWDGDGDGNWGEKDEDLSLADLRGPDVAVGRVPASRPEEAAAYLEKARAFEFDPAGRATYPLLLSDVASSVPLLGDIDGAEMVEVTFGELFPEPFPAHARRLYATEAAVDKFGGEVLTPRKVAAALVEGYALAFHNGHGSHAWLAAELDSDWVDGLDNAVPTVLASCACLSGNFADVADEATFDLWTPQGPDDDSAGERLVVGTFGAAGYLGNTAVGLGPLGGSQFLHAFFAGLFREGRLTLGEAFDYGRAHMREVNLTVLMVPLVMTDDAEWWTHMIVILLGDPALPLAAAERRGVELRAPATYGPGYNEMTVDVVDAEGAPIVGATVVLLKPDDLVVRAATGEAGSATFRFLPRGPDRLTIRATGPDLVPGEATVEPIL